MNSNHRINPVSITPTVGKQTQTREFGELLKHSMQTGANALGSVSGLLAGAPGLGMVSAAVSSITNVTARATAGVTQVSGTSVGAHAGAIASGTGIDAVNPGDSNGMVAQMRAEADRSIAVQMQMQQESRDYNTLSNVLKTRHDSAKAAINNIR